MKIVHPVHFSSLHIVGPSSYKEHGFRMMLIWAHGLAEDVNPVKELYESLTAIGKRQVAGKKSSELYKVDISKFCNLQTL